MSRERSEPKHLIEEGRRKLFVSGGLLAVVLLGLLSLAGLQYAGSLHLQQYFVPDRPEAVDPGMIYLSLAVTALLVSVFVGSWMVQAVVQIRHGQKLEQQAEPHRSGSPPANSP
jgi:hypothetical protein